MHSRWAKTAEMLQEAKEDILVCKTFPENHHRPIHSVNPLECLIREIRRRTRVVGVFPDRLSVYILVGTQLMNIDEDWRVGRSYMAKDGIQNLFDPEPARIINENDFIVEETLDNLETQIIIYTS